MIEIPQHPVIRVVTNITAIFKVTLVNIIILVTIITLLRCLFIFLLKMACFTGRQCMLAGQWEAADIMVKEDLFIPLAGVMAALTFITQFSLMNILCLVAAFTVFFQFFFAWFSTMTYMTGLFFVSAC